MSYKNCKYLGQVGRGWAGGASQELNLGHYADFVVRWLEVCRDDTVKALGFHVQPQSSKNSALNGQMKAIF